MDAVTLNSDVARLRKSELALANWSALLVRPQRASNPGQPSKVPEAEIGHVPTKPLCGVEPFLYDSLLVGTHPGYRRSRIGLALIETPLPLTARAVAVAEAGKSRWTHWLNALAEEMR